MNDTALSMKIIKSYQDLFGDDFHQRDGESFVIVHSDESEQITTQVFEDHAHIFTTQQDTKENVIQ